MKKKKLFLGAIFIIAMVFLFVGCSNDVEPSVNKVGKIAIGGNASKAISTVVTYSSEVENLYWYYSATKADDGYTSGQTEGFVAVSDPESTGLSGKILKSTGFSYGLWNIELKGFAANDSTGNAEYTSKIENFLVNADMNYANADIKVGDNATTTIVFGADGIWFENSDIITTGSDVAQFSLEVTDDKGTVNTSGSNITKQISGSKIVFQGLSYTPTSNTDITGEHEMNFVLTKQLNGAGNTTIEAALYTLKFKVMKGTKTIISGDMIKNDQTGDIQINGVQSVPATVLSKIIPVNDGAEETAATVKTTTTIQIGDLKVTYPAGAVIVPGVGGLATNNEGITSDGTVGFVYKGTTAGDGIQVTANQNVANYELSLSAPTGSTNTVLITVEKNIGKGLVIEKVFHEDDELKTTTTTNNEEYYEYNSTTGVLTLHIKHASDFYIVSKKYVASIGDKGYTTLQEAIDAAQDGDVIVLLADIALESSEKVTVNKTITLNMNEKTITGSAQELVQVGSSTTIGHLTIRGNGSISSSAGNMLTVNPNSTLDIYDGNYEGLTRTFNVLGGKVTTYGGSFSTTKENQDSLAYLENAGYCNFLGGTFTTPTNGNYGICIKDASVVNLGAKGEAGPSFSTWRPCIATNGMFSHAATININSGTYKSNRNNGTPDDQSVIQLANDSNQTQTLNVYGGYFEQTSAPNGSVFHVRYRGTININISGGSFKHLGSSLFTGLYKDDNSGGWPTVANIRVNVTNNAIAGTQTVLMYGKRESTVITRLPDLDFVVNP